VRDARAPSIAQLGVGRVGRLVLALRLRALLLLGWLAHLCVRALSHDLSIILLAGGLLRHSCLLLRRVRLLLLLRSLLLVLGPLLGSPSIAIGAIRDHSIILIRRLVVVVNGRTVRSGLLLGSANTGSGVHRVLTHLTRRLRLVLQLFSSKVRELYFGHLRITCPQLILDLYDRRDVTR